MPEKCCCSQPTLYIICPRVSKKQLIKQMLQINFFLWFIEVFFACKYYFSGTNWLRSCLDRFLSYLSQLQFAADTMENARLTDAILLYTMQLQSGHNNIENIYICKIRSFADHTQNTYMYASIPPELLTDSTSITNEVLWTCCDSLFVRAVDKNEPVK